jgi:signal-transduction protein with cAMP-binding, CBS, and nucleotidyltransferase domain
MVIISPEKDIYDAIIKMRDKDVRRLPVIHDGELIGLLTEKDILKIEPSLFDLLVERYEIREEDKKPIKNRY